MSKSTFFPLWIFVMVHLLLKKKCLSQRSDRHGIQLETSGTTLCRRIFQINSGTGVCTSKVSDYSCSFWWDLSFELSCVGIRLLVSENRVFGDVFQCLKRVLLTQNVISGERCGQKCRKKKFQMFPLMRPTDWVIRRRIPCIESP